MSKIQGLRPRIVMELLFSCCLLLRQEQDTPTQPPTVACKMEAQSEYVHVAHTFLHIWLRLVMLSRCLSTKFLRRSSGGSLLGVRCRLGMSSSHASCESARC